MSKHMSSSWRLIDVLSCVTVFAGDPERVIARFDSPSQEDRAIARLIASAPQLISFVSEYISAYENGFDGDDHLMLLAKSLVAKVTGEAHG